MRKHSILVLFVLVLTAAGSGGCADLQGAIAQASAWRGEAETIQRTLDEEIGVMQAELSRLDPGSDRAQRLSADLRVARAKRSSLDAAIAQADLVLEEARNPSDSLTTVAKGVSSWVPAPVQGPLVLGTALIATLARSRQLKQSSVSIINSISHVLDRDEQFRALFESHADTIRSIQTVGARRIVDQAQRKRAAA